MNVIYPGDELDLFDKATNWKSYFSQIFKPFIFGDVTEVGAGIGGTTPFLINDHVTSWTCLEPDLRLFSQLQTQSRNWNYSFPVNLENEILKINTVKKDCIIYIDVLEHIENDQEEVIKALSLLNPGGHLVILVPAFNWLFSSFDTSIGHCRRYNKRMIRGLIPNTSQIVKMEYLDSMGFFSSVANKLFLKQSYPTESQIRFWDKGLIPISRVIDSMIFNKLGKSLIVVVKK